MIQTSVSRRAFLSRVGGVAVLVSFGDTAGAQTPVPHHRPEAWISIAADGTVTLVNPVSEMGQGAMTALAAILAEDLEADWARVRVVDAPVDPRVYGNAALGQTMRTIGSRSVQGYYQQLRMIGAQMRLILVGEAARRWRVPPDTITVEPHTVVHAPTNRRLDYGALAKGLTLPDPLPAASPADLKPPSGWRYIGRDLQRLDMPGKTDGSAVYGIDVQLPGMLHACVLRAPVEGERPLEIDDRAARAVAGVRKIVVLPYGVGVIAETHWAAVKAKAALAVRWSTEAQARGYDSVSVARDFMAQARDKTLPHVNMVDRGDARGAVQGAARVLSAEFVAEHVAHACMEPLNATARVGADSAEVWVSNQSPQIMRAMCARALGIEPDRVTVHSTLLGGGFGRRTEGDEVVDAALLAREVPGTPVKVVWDREEDFRRDQFRPLAVQRVEIALDRDGAITGWWHRVVCESVFARIEPAAFKAYGDKDPVAAGGGTHPYAVGAHSVEWVRARRGISVGAWRGVAATYMKLPIETMIDELADLRKVDALEFRLGLLADQPRAAAVLRAVAARCGYDRPRKGRAIGIAYSDALGSHTALAAEVSLEAVTGVITVHRVWGAIDAGVAVQPATMVAQMEGAIIFGLGAALREQITLAAGTAREGNFDTYLPTKCADAPPIDVEIIATANPPTGVGEAGVAPVAPAIANAVARLSGGRRLRHLPFVPERVRAALA